MNTILDLNHASKDKRHLSNLIEDLPQDCFFNKVLCGAGGTHLALTNEKPYVIIVPATDLILSKQAQKDTYPYEVLFLYGNKSVADIETFIDNGGKKIMSTYHSLPKILRAFETTDKKARDFQLLVDEAHMLTEGDDKDFMHDEINIILQTYQNFKSHCFMTATPFPRECFPDQIIDIPLITAEWNKDVISTVNVIAQQITTKFTDYVAKICIDHLENTKEGNAYFFYNSVEAISQVCYKLIKAGYCTVDDIRIIAADKNSAYIQKYVHKDLIIENVTTEPKRLNFLTAKAFEGCDIFDEEGITYVCADAKKKHTRLEIHTKIPQIVNRIRNSKYNEEVYLLYTKSFITTNGSKSQYLRQVAESVEKASAQSIEIATASANIKELLNYELLETSEYFTKDLEGNFIPNRNAGKRALAMWESANQTYAVFDNNNNINKVEVRTPIINLMVDGGNTTQFVLPDGLEKIKLGGKKANFTKMCKEYLEALETKNKEVIDFIENYDEIFKLARTTFKSNIESDFSAVGYRRSVIEERLNIQTSCNDDKLVASIKDIFKTNRVYTKEDIKTKLQALYDREGIKKKATATAIKKWFVVKPTTDANNANCFKIIKKL